MEKLLQLPPIANNSNYYDGFLADRRIERLQSASLRIFV
jgi:hypothetical protein